MAETTEIADVVSVSNVPDAEDVRTWEAGTFYAALETSSNGIVTAASRCSPELWSQLSLFAKSLFSITRSATFVVTVDIASPTGEILDDLPLLAISKGDAEGGGSDCHLSGAAASANATRITPFFRVDATQEVKLSFDLKIIDDANIGAVQAALGYAQQVASFLGPQSAIAGRLSNQLLTGLAGKLDSAWSSAEKTESADQLTATLRRQTGNIGAADRVTFDLARYLAFGRSVEGVAQKSTIVVQFAYRPSIVADIGATGAIQWPSDVRSLLTFRPAIVEYHAQTYREALAGNKVPTFIPTLLRLSSGSVPSKEIMGTACDDLKGNLEGTVGLTPLDALAVRYAALRELTDYFRIASKASWTAPCLSGSYLAHVGQETGVDDEADRLRNLNPEYIAPGASGDNDSVTERIRLLRQIAAEGTASSLLDGTFTLTIDDPDLVPPQFFRGMIPSGAWSDHAALARDRFPVIAYGGLCGQILAEHPTRPPTIQAMAVFGRINGLPDNAFIGQRDSSGNMIVPLIVSWGADTPVHLLQIRAAPVEAIRDEYEGHVGNWPRNQNVESCGRIPPS